jgi:hypothetical protein
MSLTRREKIVAFVACLVLLVVFLFPAITSEENGFFYIVFVVAPLGYLLATDKERM